MPDATLSRMLRKALHSSGGMLKSARCSTCVRHGSLAACVVAAYEFLSSWGIFCFRHVNDEQVWVFRFWAAWRIFARPRSKTNKVTSSWQLTSGEYLLSCAQSLLH